MITIKEEFLGSVKTKRAMKLGGSDAIVAWLALKTYVSISNSGGFIPSEVIPDLEGMPKKWGRAIDALVDCGKVRPDGSRGAGLVERVAHGFALHDYEDHGTPVEVEEDRRRKARDQKRARRLWLKHQHGECPPECPHCVRGQDSRTITGQSADGPPRASGHPPGPARGSQPSPAQPEKEDPPTPFSETDSKPRDPFGDSLRGTRTQDDPDVKSVFEAWKKIHGARNSKFRQPADVRADILFSAVQTHGVDVCLQVLEASKTDSWVTGKSDDKGDAHNSVEYIFGNASAFDRMLRASEKQQSKNREGSVDRAIRKAYEAEPDLSDYVAPGGT